MKSIFLIIMSLLLFVSCGEIGEEAENLETTVFTTKVYNAGDDGVEVKDPASVKPEDTITLKNGYFQFWFNFVNKNDISVIITDIKLEVLDGEDVILTEEYIPAKHVADTVVGDVNQNYFAHLDPDPNDTKSLGREANGKFYMDDIERDLETGLFLHTVRITFNGFLSTVTRASGDDPFIKDDGVFQRIVVTNVK